MVIAKVEDYYYYLFRGNKTRLVFWALSVLDSLSRFSFPSRLKHGVLFLLKIFNNSHGSTHSPLTSFFQIPPLMIGSVESWSNRFVQITGNSSPFYRLVCLPLDWEAGNRLWIKFFSSDIPQWDTVVFESK